ncbi:MAG: hypothetical protein ACJ74U_07630 [Jatrophihabitantaceae bacterium]
MAKVGDGFYGEVLSGIRAPVTRMNIHACEAWQVAEGGSATWNPWNTTQPAAGASDYNSAHVKNYRDHATGVAATVRTLTNGHYAHILAEFRAGDGGLKVCQAVDASVWGTKHAADTYRRLFGPK